MYFPLINNILLSYTMTHNLDIQMYSFKDILELFHIDDYNITDEQIKRAKKIVLMTHPDKSKLNSDYFLFYKKAFDILFNYYKENSKQTQHVKSSVYVPINSEDDIHITNIKKKIKNSNQKKFQKEFNTLFEENMVSHIDSTKNNWFTSEDIDDKYDTPQNVNASNMSQVFRNFKQNNQAMIVHKDVMELQHSSGNSLYDDDDDAHYYACDVFGKLKFDDLRKVHKDQTIFDVCDSDYSKMKTYSSVEQMSNERHQQNVGPMDKNDAQQLLNQRESQHAEKMIQKQHKSNLKAMEYSEKNKQVMGSLFMRISN